MGNLPEKDNSLSKLGRIIGHNRGIYKIGIEESVLTGHLTGRFKYQMKQASELPVVGDWVEGEESDGQILINSILPRQTLISRKVAGVTTEEQPIASNIDVVAIVQGLDGGRNFSIRTLERYLTLAWNSGAQPLILLNKADLNQDPESLKYEAELAAPGADIIITSASNGRGIVELSEYLKGKTAVLIGPSGVGKSALSNALIGMEIQKIGANRQGDMKGRHTTTESSLFHLPAGGWLIDSPGLKEIQLWGEEEALDSVFKEIEKFASQCRFKDCSHSGEPGCAVQKGLEEGLIDALRYQSYQELKKEINYLEARQTEKGRMDLRNRNRKFGKYVRNMKKARLFIKI
jgi:ribosome biogenesis GTPase